MVVIIARIPNIKSKRNKALKLRTEDTIGPIRKPITNATPTDSPTIVNALALLSFEVFSDKVATPTELIAPTTLNNPTKYKYIDIF